MYIYIYIYMYMCNVDWGDAARRSTWTLAGHMARRTDECWSMQILDWWPEGISSKTGRPLKR